jgi:hypothetical protein
MKRAERYQPGRRLLALALALSVVGPRFAPPPARAVCGDDPRDECADDDAFGGDGCAENCTVETTHDFVIDSKQSYAVTQLQDLVIRIPLSGSLKFTIGGPGPDDGAGIARITPVVVRATDVNFGPIPVGQLACACIQSTEVPEEFGPGNAARGELGCDAGGLDVIDFSLTWDHVVPGEEDPLCESGDTGRPEGPSDPHPGICNGERRFNPISPSNPVPPGSMRFADNISFTLVPGPCAADTCLLDDAERAPGRNIPVTTGRAVASVLDANAEDNLQIAPGADCGGGTCQVELTGEPFDCAAVAADPVGGLETGRLAMAFPILHYPSPVGPQDAVVTVLLVARPPCPGDCNRDHTVDVAEVVRGVRIARNERPPDDCARLDANGSGRIEVDELVVSVDVALHGCP